MNRCLAGSISAVAAAVVGFSIRVGIQGCVRTWVSAHMQGHVAIQSWDVRYLALPTSSVTGIGANVYARIRSRRGMRP